jgi:tetratricopeptide (TPR) repeat protein
VISEVGDRIVAAIAGEIEAIERNRAVLRPPESLSAWQAYHRGLWHMHRFQRAENQAAQHFFERAVRLDPTFSRAHAGLSFTHWQSAFQRWADREQGLALAMDAAGRALMADERDPAAHLAMGRAQWLSGRLSEAVGSLKQSVCLSPNFAFGYYSLAFVQSQSGDPSAAVKAADHSRLLSPMDPFLTAMLGVRALALTRLGQFEEAAVCSAEGAAQPNAHLLCIAVAAMCHAIAGRIEDARAYVETIRKGDPSLNVGVYLRTFQFPPDAAALFSLAAQRIGFV